MQQGDDLDPVYGDQIDGPEWKTGGRGPPDLSVYRLVMLRMRSPNPATAASTKVGLGNVLLGLWPNVEATVAHVAGCAP